MNNVFDNPKTIAIVGVIVTLGLLIWGWLFSTESPTSSPPTATTASTTTPLAVELPPRAETSASATNENGCLSGLCPQTLAYATEGCTCAGQSFDSSLIDAMYCCATGFSNEVCAASLAEEAQIMSIFGATEEDVEAQLVEVEILGWPVWVHEKIAPAVQRVNEHLQDIDYTINEKIDCFFWSEIPESGVYSRHAFGIALDINPSTNPMCGVNQPCECFNDLITDMPPEFVDAFKQEGFIWGGDWSEHPDPMHFEWDGWREQPNS